MYHVTRCPNCRTSFRLTDSHLSAFGGKVRCGRCAFVFDARDHFVGETIDDNGPMTVIAAEPQQRRRPKPETPPPADAPVTVAPTPAEAQTGPTPAQQSLQKLADTLAKREGRPVKREPMLELNIDIGHVVSPPPEPPPPPPPPPQPSPQPAPPFQIDHAVEEIVIDVPKEPDAESPAPDAPVPDSPWPEAAKNDNANATEEHEGYHPILTAEDEVLIRGPVQKSPLRWLWTIPIAFAAIGLAGQLIYHYRVEMAVQLPGLKPQLERFCARMGCVVEQPARAQYLRTEWSELNFLPEHPELIQLNATLRNQAPFEQELPLLELTLTDEQERILSKKVFGPRDYLAPLADGTASPLPPALTANGDLRVFLRLDVGDQKSTGYLLTWFYPQAR